MIIPQKFWPFIKSRLFTVSLLWTGVYLIYLLAPVFLQGMAEGGKAVKFQPVALASFADGHIVAALFLGIVFVAGIFSLLLMNVSVTGTEQSKALSFIYRVWDEVSSASTHVGCAYAAAVLSPAAMGHQATLLDAGLVAIYLAIGFFAFHFESPGNSPSTQPATPSAPPAVLGNSPLSASSIGVPATPTVSTTATKTGP